MNLSTVNETDPCGQYVCSLRPVSVAYVLLYVCVSAVFLITVCGNLLVIISVCHFKQLHTPTNMLVLSLAVSDLLVGLIVMPFHLIWLTESCWLFGQSMCVIYIYISFCVTSMSIYNIALIAVDRYFAISSPFIYIEKVTVSKICAVILSSWIVLLSYNYTVLYFNGNSSGVQLCPGLCVFVLREVWSLVDLVFAFVIPFSTIIIFYVLVFVIAKKHATAIRALNNQTKSQTSKNMSDSMKSERKAAKVLGILVSVFLACLLPYFVYTLVRKVVETIDLFETLVVIVYLNSAINPIIYAMFYSWFRRCIKVILTLEIFREINKRALMNDVSVYNRSFILHNVTTECGLLMLISVTGTMSTAMDRDFYFDI